MFWLPDVELEVVECGDAGDGVVDPLAAASALAEDLVDFEADDAVFCDGAAFTETAVVSVFDDASSGPRRGVRMRSLPR
ncbi:hypothetical protein ACWGQ5_43580 [Streptomyces sp. NPDC055722]